MSAASGSSGPLPADEQFELFDAALKRARSVRRALKDLQQVIERSPGAGFDPVSGAMYLFAAARKQRDLRREGRSARAEFTAFLIDFKKAWPCLASYPSYVEKAPTVSRRLLDLEDRFDGVDRVTRKSDVVDLQRGVKGAAELLREAYGVLAEALGKPPVQSKLR